MIVELTSPAKQDLEHWRNKSNIKILNRIKKLLLSISETPFSGIGKPEPLKYQLTGKWSRRIDHENRLIYSVKNNIIYVYSFKRTLLLEFFLTGIFKSSTLVF